MDAMTLNFVHLLLDRLATNQEQGPNHGQGLFGQFDNLLVGLPGQFATRGQDNANGAFARLQGLSQFFFIGSCGTTSR